MIDSLRQRSEEGPQDGMDIAITSYNVKTKTLEFSGANNSLTLIRKGELSQIKGDKMPIALYPIMDSFTNHIVDSQENDCLYMFSDGFVDQFGGPKGKKLKVKLFHEYLLEICELPMIEQRDLLGSYLKNWMSYPSPNEGEAREQVDDILVIGARL